MPDSLLAQLQNIRQLFREAAPTDSKTINDYAWIIAKALTREYQHLGSFECRTLLADYLKLSTARPSRLHSTILSAAIKIASAYPVFRFVTFLKMWGVANLRLEDYERQQSSDGKSFPSLAERTAKALAYSYLLHPEDYSSDEADSLFEGIGSTRYTIHPMLVSRIKEATGKDGRKYHFVTLTSPEGIEVETISHNLQFSPLHPLPEGKRHYANIGQLYTCLLRAKTPIVRGTSPSAALPSAPVPDVSSSELTLDAAYLSSQRPLDFFSTAIGYIEAIDVEYNHMHIYDYYSRHFVAHVQRFSREEVGNFVRFIPITPQASKFKTAIILSKVPDTSHELQPLIRSIRITIINKEKNYATWELIDKDRPITELLSPFQLSQGEQSPSFTTGFISLSAIPSELSVGTELKALIYLKRGKDHQKRPHVARIFY